LKFSKGCFFGEEIFKSDEISSRFNYEVSPDTKGRTSCFLIKRNIVEEMREEFGIDFEKIRKKNLLREKFMLKQQIKLFKQFGNI